MSFSWGGVATLLALAQRPGRIRRAVVNSFSPQLNPAMLDYLHRGLDYLAACDRTQIGNLVNETIGRYLPQLFKRYNFRHVSSLDEHEYHQIDVYKRQGQDPDGAGSRLRRLQPGCNRDRRKKRKFPESDQRHGPPERDRSRRFSVECADQGLSLIHI